MQNQPKITFIKTHANFLSCELGIINVGSSKKRNKLFYYADFMEILFAHSLALV